MAHDLLTRESPEIIRFFQDIGHITELLKSKPDRYRPVLNLSLIHISEPTRH